MSIGKRVRQVREYNKLTHHDFSTLLKEKENRIKSVEYDKQRAPGDLLAKIVTEFQVNALWLLTGKGEMQSDSVNILRETPPCYSTDQEAFAAVNQRQARLAMFIQYWIKEKSEEDQIWLEGQLNRFVPDYAEFIADKE